MRIVFFRLFAAVLLSTGVASAQSNLVLLLSQPGDYVGQGQSYITTNPASFSLSGTPATVVSVSAFGYGIEFDGPGSTGLSVGQYTNAARYPFNGNSPGLTVSGNGRGCNTVCGFFEILELHTDGAGQVDRFWATFTHICECFMAPMTGEIRYHSQSAPPLPSPKIIHVPAQYPTIQAAVNNASPLAADTVLVAPGTYFENINFKGKAVAVVSEGGPQATIIDGKNSGPVITFESNEGHNSVIRGFTLQHGSASWGAGITLLGSSPTIVSNIFQNNAQGAGGFGAGIGGNSSSPIIQQNVFRNNTADNQFLSGVVSFVNGSSPIIANNVFLKNACRAINMTLPEGTSPIVINNTIVSNSVGIRVDARVNTAAQSYHNNILAGNTIGLEVDFGSALNYPTWTYNLVTGGQNYQGIPNQTGTNGNISADPLFACVPGDDYHLLGVSPCVDRGTNGAPQLPETDFDGTARILDGNSNAVAVVDMGAFELDPAAPPVPCLYITCPSNIVVSAVVGQNSAVVNYPAAIGTPVATITSSPPSGSVFSQGTNTVTCSATYGTNSARCTFTVTVLVAPSITREPQDTNVLAGLPFTLTVGAAGSSPLSYRWTFEGNTLSGATGSTLVISNAQVAQEGIYRAVVSNAVGVVTSAVAFVRVLPSVPTILANPASLSLPASSNAAFTVLASGSQPLAYQWLFNGAPINGAATAQYALNNIQSSNAGSYRVIVANGLGAAISAVATLTVTPLAPYFVTQPVGASMVVGSSRTLTALARGSEPISYQWQRDSVKLPGATQSSLTLTNLSLSDGGGYTLVASNISGMSTSLVAQLIIYQPPTLGRGLTNQVVDAGDTVLLEVPASAVPAPAYAWQFNGVAIAGTNATLTLTNIQLSQAGYYRVTITNPYGSTSSIGRISVLGPQSLVVAWGDNSGNQTNVPAGPNDIVAVAGGDYHSLALRHNGSLVAWGYNGDGQTNVPTSALRVVSIAAGASHNLAITESGSVLSWGRNDFGQRNVPVSASNGVLAVAAGESHSSALLASGTIVNWGDNSFGQVSGSANLTGIRAIAAGRHHGLALRNSGSVVGWGFNAYAQAAPPPALTDASAIAAGYLHSVALRSNGTVVVWGDNSYRQTNVPPGLSNVIAIAAGDFHTLALHADGSVVGWGNDSFGQTDIPSTSVNTAGIAAGYYHGLALIPAPILHLSSVSSGLVIEWSGPGVLQWAPTPTGQYTDIPALNQRYTNWDFSAPARYYRLRR